MTDFTEIAAAVDAQAGETPADARKELGKYAVRDQVAVLATGGGGSQPLLPGFVYDAELDYVRVNDDTDTTFVQFQRDAKRLVADSLKVDGAAAFNGETTAYNDNGDELFECDPLANGGDGEVRINGATFSPAGYQQTSEKAQPNGYASLDSGGLVPTAQLPETPAVVPDVAYTEASSGTVLSQGNVTADAANTIRWQRIGRTVHARVYLQTEDVGEEGEAWLVDLPSALPAIEYSGGSNGPVVVGSGYVSIGVATLRVVTALAGEDLGGPGPTRRLSFAAADAGLGIAGASDRMGAGTELQLSLVYEAAAAA